MSERRQQREPPRYRAGESGDYTSMRINGRRGPDRLTKWAVGAFLTLLLAVVTGLGSWAFSLISTDASTALTNSNENSGEINLLKLEQTHIKDDVQDLKDGQETIVKGQQKIIDTLYTLPSQRRSQPKPVLPLPAEASPSPAEDPDQ